MLNRIRRSAAVKDQGFTLIELLVVIIIIGILAAIAIPVFLNQRKKAVDAGLKSDLHNAAVAAETILTDNPTPIGPPMDEIRSAASKAETVLADAGFHATKRNVLYFASNRGGYCITAENPDASEKYSSAAHHMLYDSLKGGILGAGDYALACAL